MKRSLLSVGAALTLVVAALPTSADAQSLPGGPGGGRGGGGGAPAVAAPGGGGGGGARGAPSMRSGGPQGGGGGGQAFVARPGGAPGGAPQGGGQAYMHRGGSPQGGGQAFVQPGGGGNWHNGNNQHRRHFRGGPVFGFVAPSPYYYGYTSPNYYYEEDDSCYELRYIRGAYRQVWVCE